MTAPFLLHLCSLFAIYAIAGTKRDVSSGGLNVSVTPESVLSQQSSQHFMMLLCSSNLSRIQGQYVDCSQNEPLLTPGSCAMYNEDRGIFSLFSCPDFQPTAEINEPIKLPSNFSKLNDSMCGPFNRKGTLCDECADGFGLSVTSFGFRCVNCTDTAWYGMPLFLLLKFAPITVVYFIVLMFQIKVTSAPMPCFIMYAQLVVLSFNISPYFTFAITENWQLKLDVKVIVALYGLFSLNVCHHNILPPYCISSMLQPVHLGLINYLSVFYPLLVIFLTWLCVELHGRNFRPLVWLYRPFHRCFVQLRRGWDTKSDIIDVFTTFFIISYDQLVIQSLMLSNARPVIAADVSGTLYITYHSILDPISIHRHPWYIVLVPIFLVALTFCILPPLFLILYPLKTFRSCLSKCRLSSVALNIFVEKMQGCYRNGLDSGRDMRSFSGLYFFLRMMIFIVVFLSHRINKHFLQMHAQSIYSVGVLLLITTLTMALAKPYKKAYMNYLDVLLLSIFTILCFTLSLRSTWYAVQVISRILLVISLLLFILFVASKWLKYLVRKFDLKYTLFNVEVSQSSVTNTPSASMVQSASTILGSYGTM